MFFFAYELKNETEKTKLEQIYLAYRDKMWYVANQILKDPYSAEDAVHDALLGISKHLDSLDDVNSKRTFAYVVICAKHSALNIAKKQSKILLSIEAFDYVDLNQFGNDFTNSELNEIAENAIMKVPEKYREVLYLRFVLEMSTAEIASALKQSNASVRQQINRGKKMFVTAFGKEGQL